MEHAPSGYMITDPIDLIGVGKKTEVLHLIHSLDPRTGGVLSAVILLNKTLNQLGVNSRISDDPKACPKTDQEWVIAHGLWQWPGRRASELKNPYLVYPHGMLDPWFKKTYPLKHLKKQIYWWAKQGAILRGASAVCFTTEEERLLAQQTFYPYQAKEIVTGLGVGSPPNNIDQQGEEFRTRFPQLADKKTLIYLGRFHPKKGVDYLINAWRKRKPKDDEALVLAGPQEANNQWIKSLKEQAREDPSIHWTGMLEGDAKWGALRLADAMILPSHQENYGMVIAEACSVGLPVYMTDKVNLWRDVVEAGAGEAEKDTPEGVCNLIGKWMKQDRKSLGIASEKCFRERLHIERTAERLIRIMKESTL